ncbi:hypothetical protein K439DRAFT_1620832 [Ramaria rubella]|nr:hypothetical protein K439DRAFT_1620832 [Ramaria rubella]
MTFGNTMPILAPVPYPWETGLEIRASGDTGAGGSGKTTEEERYGAVHKKDMVQCTRKIWRSAQERYGAVHKKDGNSAARRDQKPLQRTGMQQRKHHAVQGQAGAACRD